MKLLLASLLFQSVACPLWADLDSIEKLFRAAYEVHLGTNYTADVAALDANYLEALKRAMVSATQGQRRDEALAFWNEIQRIKEKAALQEKDDGADPTLEKFRKTYRAQMAHLIEARRKAAAPMVVQFGAALDAHREELIESGKLHEADLVRDYQLANLEEKLIGKAPAQNASATVGPEIAFTNSLGMRFVPVPIFGGPTSGRKILFSIWETRLKDYAAFVEDTKREWPKPDFAQTEDHPVVAISWIDATTFCAWLTKREQTTRMIGPQDAYRIPTDHEWSCAVGIGTLEDAAVAPVRKAVLKEFPWGPTFPPPKGAGNYCGTETMRKPIARTPPSLVTTMDSNVRHRSEASRPTLSGFTISAAMFRSGVRIDTPMTAPMGGFCAVGVGEPTMQTYGRRIAITYTRQRIRPLTAASVWC